jgi:phosphate transport system protein
VLDREPQIDYLALDADEEVFLIITRRQPTAVDLRIVLALARIAGEAERAADKAARIARGALDFRADDTALPTPIGNALRAQDELVRRAFERSITAVAQFDSQTALTIFEDEPGLIAASHSVHSALCGPSEVPLSAANLGALFEIAHALEHIGRHAGAIAEQVIYVAEGKDVRFRNREILIETLRHRPG